MSSFSSADKYYRNIQDLKKQAPTIFTIGIMFLVTILYASGLQNPNARKFMTYLSLGYLVVILLSLASNIPRLNYYYLDTEGLYCYVFGFRRKLIRWSDTKSISRAVIYSNEGIGIRYRPSSKNVGWMQHSRRKMLGWDELIGESHKSNGASLTHDAIKMFNRRSGITKRQSSKLVH